MFAIDYQKTTEQFFETQQKLFKGAEIMLDLRETDVTMASTPKELIYQEDKMQLYHYQPVHKETSAIPTLIVYALVNRQYMMDIQDEKSVISNWLDLGLDVYLVDWGYPDKSDKYLELEDYIDGYMNKAVDIIRQRNNVDKINLLGVCQGGTFSTIYTALYPEKIKNLVTMVSPIDFSIEEGLLFYWSRFMDIDNLVNAYGVIPGDFMNSGFLMLKPFQLNVGKYVGLMDNIDNPDVLTDFLRMEKWIFDSPGQAGEAFRKFIKDLYQENKLIKNELEIGGRKVNLKNINMPLLNVYAENDHLVPPSSSKPLNDAVSSTDIENLAVKAGHIGIYVGSKSQKEVAPGVANWLNERSNGKITPQKNTKKRGPKKTRDT